jgi:GDP-L-fucose synthase
MLDGKIFVAGHRGMVGSALLRALEARGSARALTVRRDQLDLLSQTATHQFLQKEKPDIVVVAAAKVGGIHANNTYPADFIYENLMVAANLVHGSFLAGVPRLLFLGSSCIYPRMAPQPIPEEALLTSELEKTNEAYAVAKIAGLKLCQYYRRQHAVLYHSAMPTNLYGPGDNYHPENSHVLPALIRRFHQAKLDGLPSVSVWGSGNPRREFLHVDDLAEACLFLLEQSDPPDWINVGFGSDVSIRELAETVRDAVGYQGELIFDASKPDGTPRKLMDSSRLRQLGWRPKVELREGIADTYQRFLGERELTEARL